MLTITKIVSMVNNREEVSEEVSSFISFISFFISVSIPLFFTFLGMLLYHGKDVIITSAIYIMNIEFIGRITIIGGIFIIILSLSGYIIRLFRLVCVVVMISILISLSKILQGVSK